MADLGNEATTVTGLNWMRSSFCSGGTCVAVLVAGSHVMVRDTKQTQIDSDPSFIVIGVEEWSTFLERVVSGTAAVSTGDVVATGAPTGAVSLRANGTTLCFDAKEWADFVNGVRCGDFEIDEHIRFRQAHGSGLRAAGAAALPE